MHYLLLIITMVCHISQGVVLGFLCLLAACLSAAAALLQHHPQGQEARVFHRV